VPVPSLTSVATLERPVAGHLHAANLARMGQGLERGGACTTAGSPSCTGTACSTIAEQRHAVQSADTTPIMDLDAELRRRVQRIRLRAN